MIKKVAAEPKIKLNTQTIAVVVADPSIMRLIFRDLRLVVANSSARVTEAKIKTIISNSIIRFHLQARNQI
jgi:hypothetical protein